ncbi:MAG: metallophosphatase family protein [Magnetospirillum sp.]|nr:metallophosphatase family protein [Magnetospirillum sp.]
MKLVIVADIHGNYDAWRALPEEYDELWVLGDLVNYGPQPGEVVEAVMKTASLVVQGNHDHAVAHDDDSQWTVRYRAMAEATRRYTSSVLSDDHKAYLRDLPVQAQAERDGSRFHLVHAMPSKPFYGRCQPDGDEWASEIDGLVADILLVGHSHAPFIRHIGDKVLVNPGSIGQPRTGKPLANYAVWQDGKFELKSFPYPVETTVKKLKVLGFPHAVEAELVNIFTTGSV